MEHTHTQPLWDVFLTILVPQYDFSEATVKINQVFINGFPFLWCRQSAGTVTIFTKQSMVTQGPFMRGFPRGRTEPLIRLEVRSIFHVELRRVGVLIGLTFGSLNGKEAATQPLPPTVPLFHIHCCCCYCVGYSISFEVAWKMWIFWVLFHWCDLERTPRSVF